MLLIKQKNRYIHNSNVTNYSFMQRYIMQVGGRSYVCNKYAEVKK